MKIDETDRLTVNVKRQAGSYLKRYYGAFGWTLVCETEHEQYEDTLVLTFSRPHFIENKDDLQLLQVQLEIALNNTGRYAGKKNARATIFGIAVGLLAAALAGGGVCLIVLLGGILPIVSGAVLCVAGAAAGAVCGLFANKFYKSDCKKYDALIAEEIGRIEIICEKARAIRGQYENADDEK